MTGAFPAKLNSNQRVHTVVAGSLDNRDALLDNDIAVLSIRRRGHSGQQGQVDTKGLVGHGAAAADLVAQMLGGGLGQGSQDSETASVRHGRSELSGTNLYTLR